MIPARKSRLAEAFFRPYLARKLRRTFHGIHIRGAERLASLPADRPAIAFANHTNWWDLLMVFRLTRCAPRKESYGMMEEKNLRENRFLAGLGAFSVDLESRRAAVAGLRYALGLLEKPESLVWIFPQGRLCHPDAPVEVRPGLPFLCVRAPRAVVVPVAFRYEFFRDDLPVALVSVGAPLPALEMEESRLASALQAEADSLAAAARARDLSGFSPLLAPRLSVNKKWEWVRRALTGRLAGFDPAN